MKQVFTVACTDCDVGEGAIPATGATTARFFGQADMAAVLVLVGLGDGRSNVSAAALDQTVLE
ncbi:hypothetical protein C8A05DRAFT_38652 [Staphylotrichum tortipilum]|uniref:Uncharacterized protein n=1 Tax=Staphylotrichum tortipilum TaxID=2831512 RepID=A0AAN6MC69_9PEZI|nr:hypothetical protein C8A05DRAFT_38652 [Staphylotrichum longicolle]